MFDTTGPLWRRDEEEAFGSVGTITRPSGTPVWDGSKYTTPTVTVYSGAGRLHTADTDTTSVQAGDRTHLLKRLEWHIPYTVDARVDDTVTISSSPDPLAEGVSFRVIEVTKGDWTTVRRLVIQEQT